MACVSQVNSRLYDLKQPRHPLGSPYVFAPHCTSMCPIDGTPKLHGTAPWQDFVDVSSAKKPLEAYFFPAENF